jgi:chromosome segregation ATPase
MENLGQAGSRDADARLLGMGSPQAEIKPDENRDETRRICGYRRCASVLPLVTGRGNRARFCQDGKTWGGRDLSCREAEAALVDTDSLRDNDAALDGTSVAALGEQVDRALEPARGLLEALTGIRGQLDTTVADAFTQRDTAEQQSAEQQRLRGLAEAHAADAQAEVSTATESAEVATRDRTDAERDRDSERRTRIEAEQAQQRADGRTAALQDELTRALARTDAAVARTADLDRSIAAMTAELAALRTTLAEEQARTASAAARAETAEGKLVTDLEHQAATHRAQFDAAEARYRQQLADSRAETERVRERLEQNQQAARRAYDETLAGLHAMLNTLNRELGAAQYAREQATAQTELAVAGLAQFKNSVRDALGDKELPQGVRALLESP